jgi:hypothetical protein
MSSSNWRDGENRELPTIMGEKVMQLHLTKTWKDGAVYEKDAEERSLRGFVGIKNKWSAKERIC